MFKCTHCGHVYDGNMYSGYDIEANVTGRMLGLRIKDDDTCPRCGDGTLRPRKDGLGWAREGDCCGTFDSCCIRT